MYTIRNSNNGQQVTAKDKAQLERILRNVVKNYGGREALKGMYVDKAGERDPYYAEELSI